MFRKLSASKYNRNSNQKPVGRHDQIHHSKTYENQRIVPKGLPNLGNTCYLNATLQCLYWCPGFHDELAENKYKIGAVGERLLKVFECMSSSGNHDSRQTNFSCGLQDSTHYYKEKVKKLLNRIRERNDQFIGYEQQDSFEALNTILSSINEDCKKGMSPVERIFGGMFITAFVHSQCKQVDVVFQNFTNISVPVKESKMYSTHALGQWQQNREQHTTGVKTIHVGNNSTDNISDTDLLCYTRRKMGQSGIEKGLQEVAKDEKLEANILPCRKCHDKTSGDIYKKSTVGIIPKVLVVHISRFSQTGRSLLKNQAHVTYPEELNISDFCSSAVEISNVNERDMMFKLCGIVEHTGTMDFGHYVAYINASCGSVKMHSQVNLKERKEEIEKFLSSKIQQKETQTRKECQWFRISDSDVSVTSSEIAFNLKDAYILFYTSIR